MKRLEYECPRCQNELQSALDLREKITRCPRCQALIYLATDERPLPEIFDMELGPDPFLVKAREVEELPPPPLSPPLPQALPIAEPPRA